MNPNNIEKLIMKLNFKTRGEARKHCWSMNIPLKNISKTGAAAAPWVVETNDVGFTVGKTYKLADVAGFIRTKYGTENQVNKLQAEQFTNHAPKGVTIKSIDVEEQAAIIEMVPGISFLRLRLDEARFFTEVELTPDAEAKKPAKSKAKAKKAVAAPVAVNPDLDAELNGGTPQNPKEKKPGNWIVGETYVLVDPKGFANFGTPSNSVLSKSIQKNGGKVKVTSQPQHYKGHGGVYFELADGTKQTGCTSHVLFLSERKFFVEADTVRPLVVTSGSASVSTVDVAKQKRDERSKELLAALSKAVSDHSAALAEVSKAATAVRDAAAALAKHASK